MGTRRPTINSWAFMVLVVAFLCQTAIWLPAQTNKTAINKTESSQTTADIQNEAKEKARLAVLGSACSSSFKPREVGNDELVEKRSEIEDGLRKGLLACSKKGDFKDLLNAPWNEQTVEQFGKLVIPESNEPGPFSSYPSVDEHQWLYIVGLLAFMATTHRDQPVGQLAAEAFDNALAWAASKPNYYNYWHYCMSAIGRYGSSDLLTPTFWKARDQGLNCYEAFNDLGNEKDLMKLKNEPATDELKAIGLQLKRANMPIPQHRYRGEGKNQTETNSVVEKRSSAIR